MEFIQINKKELTISNRNIFILVYVILRYWAMDFNGRRSESSYGNKYFQRFQEP
jgi:hypothetical protein